MTTRLELPENDSVSTRVSAESRNETFSSFLTSWPMTFRRENRLDPGEVRERFVRKSAKRTGHVRRPRRQNLPLVDQRSLCVLDSIARLGQRSLRSSEIHKLLSDRNNMTPVRVSSEVAVVSTMKGTNQMPSPDVGL